MLQDVAALAPPTIMCVAFLLGVGWFLRREMGPQRRRKVEESGLDSEADGPAAHAVMAQREDASRAGDHREDA
jgi:hypothetical protein